MKVKSAPWVLGTEKTTARITNIKPKLSHQLLDLMNAIISPAEIISLSYSDQPSTSLPAILGLPLRLPHHHDVLRHVSGVFALTKASDSGTSTLFVSA